MKQALVHRMPFGAEPGAEGAVRFRLWAPDANRVDLCLEHVGGGASPRPLAMAPETRGWFALTTAEARSGSRYRYRINDGMQVPDPASRFQPEGVHGPSEVIDPGAYRWKSEWQGRPWEEAVVYELHVGTFTAGGTFASARDRLPHLAGLGITAIEVMPVAAFAGSRNWGYDGVLPYAPHAAYGRPDEFREFVDAAHGHGLMVLLDVVYNHFGPEGNYLHTYASRFFTDRHQTPWGDAINYDGAQSRTVRDYFRHNALYWLEEFRLDGLRLDAVHAIMDDSEPDILEELADAVHRGPGRTRPIHLVLENYANEAHYLSSVAEGKRRRYAAQWNDDYHHVCHTLLTGEADGYYVDYADEAVSRLARCLCEGFAYQGEPSKFNHQTMRGEPSGELPLTAFIAFLQNHDQVGNRAHGERLIELTAEPKLRAMTSIMLMNPSVPALFMGEEFGCRQPFLYFADFDGELAEAVRNGRKREFVSFAQFNADDAQVMLPDPIDSETFRRCILRWETATEPQHAEWLEFYRELLDLRRRFVVPGLPAQAAAFHLIHKTGLLVSWRLKGGALLTLLANLGDSVLMIDPQTVPEGRLLHAQPANLSRQVWLKELPPWSAAWRIGGIEA
jgi:malto-oligosyltrehalose trehalohydrolase